MDYHSESNGNGAAMREALEAALKTIRGVINSTISPRSNTVFDCRDKLSAALAKPPRQCDVGTAEEQSKRLDAFCASHGHGFDGQKCYCCENCQFTSIDRCELAWAQMPYNESEAGK